MRAKLFEKSSLFALLLVPALILEPAMDLRTEGGRREGRHTGITQIQKTAKKEQPPPFLKLIINHRSSIIDH